VENASYGATVCAERNAIFQSIAMVGAAVNIEHLVLVTEQPATPCGMCLQVISEFSTPETRITLATPSDAGEDFLLAAFLPKPFSPDSLPDHV
jgi:homotetrameric cytidine deaminase